MKALIVSPYLDHLGGGERYMLTLASVLESLGYTLHFGWDNPESITKIAELLAIPLKTPLCLPAFKDLYHGHNPLKTYFATKNYDLVVYLSDGSLPLLGGKKNLVHMQVPFHNVGGKSWKNALKKRTIDHVIVNSEFTKRIVDAEYDINSVVIYPPVPTLKPSAQKENLILSVGRFEPSLNAKKQDILIEAFAELSPKLPGWKLILAGGSTNEAWIQSLTEKIGTIPIELKLNCSNAELIDLYSRAKIYWHAAGYGVDEAKNPELTEHFGISTVEAISAGAIPLVVGRGGQVEIVRDTSLLWDTISELVSKTLAVINNPSPFNADISKYNLDSFQANLQKLL